MSLFSTQYPQSAPLILPPPSVIRNLFKVNHQSLPLFSYSTASFSSPPTTIYYFIINDNNQSIFTTKLNQFKMDFNSATHHAKSHHSTEDPSFFDTALSFLQDRQNEYADPSHHDIDEDHAVRSHQAMYGSAGAGGASAGDEGTTHDSRSIGAGAAMQALKMFTSGGASDGGMDQNQLIGMAMAQASQLWDQKANSGANMVCFLSLFHYFLLCVTFFYCCLLLLFSLSLSSLFSIFVTLLILLFLYRPATNNPPSIPPPKPL